MSVNFKDLGFATFEIDSNILHEKHFPSIGYTLCESDDDTFTISDYNEGDIIARFNNSEIKVVLNVFNDAESQISEAINNIRNNVELLKKVSL